MDAELGVVLASLVVLLAVVGGAVAASAGASEQRASTHGAENGAENTQSGAGTRDASPGESVDEARAFDVAIEDGRVDLFVAVGGIDIRLRTYPSGEDDASVTLTHGAVDDGVARSAAAGLCAAGLTGDGSPMRVDIDPDADRVETDLRTEPSTGSSTRTGADADGYDQRLRTCAADGR